MKKSIALLCSALGFLPMIVFAHPGHGTTDGYTITHYFTEPDHLLYASIVSIISVVFFFRFKNKSKKTNS